MPTLAHCTGDGSRADEKSVGYVRISTAAQSDHFGLSVQESQIQKYVQAHPSLSLLRIYREQRSGADLNRPELQKLLHDASTGEFTKVIIPRTDRLSRDLYGALFIEKTLLVHNVEVISCSEPLSGKDPITAALRQITVIFATLERQLIRDRMLAGRMKKLSEGRYAGGRPPFGYRVQDGELMIEEKERDLLLLIRKMRWGRHSHNAIANRLNALGYKTKLGKPWSDNGVKYVLSNEIYKKRIRYGGVETDGRHDPIR